MRLTIFLAIVLCALTCLHCQSQEDDEKRPVITLEQLCRSDVIGDLGVPLGKVVNIDAIVVAGNLGKGEEGRYFLNVEAVDGKKLPKRKKMPFSVHPMKSVKLASDNFELYKIKTGQEASRLDSTQIANLQKGYVGQRKTWIVYETGGYAGIPNNRLEDVGGWQDHGFGFINKLMVLSEQK